MKIRKNMGRQLIFWIIALQILNLSVGSPASEDSTTYDYSYTYNKTYDPTESAVEWIVELEYGQQPEFSYNLHEDTGKSPVKNLHWKTDLQSMVTEISFTAVTKILYPELPSLRICANPLDICSPPPELG